MMSFFKSMIAAVVMMGLVGVYNAQDQQYSFNGLHMSLGSLPKLSDAESRSISAENFTGAKGEGGEQILMGSEQLGAV